ncbi:MAG TPA: pyrroloquinoline quinone biosynthesis peptide chaperone PqqD [Gammaproteobacteria bacterium]|nr:pyrroloquinoline quinone biosynthesis peptide chaperone PqqD [Gammaproteobacteria bacterium]
MAESLRADSVPRLAPACRLQWEEAQQAYVLLYPEGMVTLNASAHAVLTRCDGERTVDEILAGLWAAFPDADLTEDVYEFMEVAREEGWICSAD